MDKLNPYGLRDIKKALQLPPDRRIWFFLHDAIPNKNRDEDLYYDKDTNTFVAISCMATDMLYSCIDTPGELDKTGHATLRGYIPLIRDCYRPYKYWIEPHPRNDTEQAFLNTYIQRGKCKASINKAPSGSVPAIIYFSISGTDVNKRVKIYLNGD